MYGDTQVTKQIKNIIQQVSGTEKHTVLGQACEFFIKKSKEQPQIDEYTKNISELESKLAQDTNAKNCAQYQNELVQSKQDLDNFINKDQGERLDRHDNIVRIAREILSLSEGLDFDDTLRKSSRFLATIQLTNPTEGKQVADHNERSKPVYKAILCLRLFDQMLIDGLITDPYVLECLGEVTPQQYQQFINEESEQYQKFAEQVKVPLIIVALLQDIGNYHPEAQIILKGKGGDQNPYRILDTDARKQLLQINYRETMQYINYGIGKGKYLGNFKAERDIFDEQEVKKVAFMQSLLKRWANAKNAMGNMLKVPQIYTSIVLSTKDNYDYRMLPKVYQVLNLNVERGHIHSKIVNCLYRITGMFPMGYGITYIPRDSAGNSLERYEYAIVTRLYPAKVKVPECRVATRSLSFISRGQDIAIEPKSNLYFPETAKQLSTMSKERLNEILEKLASNFKERQHLDVIPRCWHAKEFFSIGKNQNLWNKTSE